MSERIMTTVYVNGRKVGTVIDRGAAGFLPTNAEGHSIGQPLNTIDGAVEAVQALGVHQPADGD
jgi:hypothetical protein